LYTLLALVFEHNKLVSATAALPPLVMVKLRQEWTQVSVFNNISNIPVLFGQLGLGDNTRHFIFSLIIISQLFFTRQKSGGKKPWTGLAYPPFYLSLRDFGGRNKQWGDATACL